MGQGGEVVAGGGWLVGFGEVDYGVWGNWEIMEVCKEQIKTPTFGCVF